jgi:hypothetical protein
MNHTAVYLCAAAATLGGCGSITTIDDFRPTSALLPIEQGEKVAILGRSDAGHYETDRGFMDCLGKQLSNSEFQVMTEEQFVDLFYPWFEPRTAPKHLKRLQRLMQQPVIREKVQQQKISYLVWLDGEVESDDMDGAMHCGLGPYVAGCWGYTTWAKNAMFEATIWDLVDLTEEARIRVDSEGTSYVIGLGAPIPLLTRVESEACEGMGNQLKSYFAQKGG